jgi:hypothetical protein
MKSGFYIFYLNFFGLNICRIILIKYNLGPLQIGYLLFVSNKQRFNII